MTSLEKDVINYIECDIEETREHLKRFVILDENTLGYTDEIIKVILTEDYELEENTEEYLQYKKAFENACFIHTRVETAYGECLYHKYDPEWDELYEEYEEWEEEIEYEITMKKIAQEEYKMKFEAVTLVNSNNEKVKKQLEKKLVNRIKKLFKK